MRPISAQANPPARSTAQLHEEAPWSTPRAYLSLAAQAPDPLTWPLPHTALAQGPASPRRPYLQRSSSSSMRKRRRACSAFRRQPRRCRLSFRGTPASVGSASSSSGIASDLEGRGELPHSGVFPPVQLADNLQPEDLCPRIPPTSKRLQALETARMPFFRKRHDQVQINVLALAGRLELARVNLDDSHVLVLHWVPAAICSALGSSLGSRVWIRHDLKGFFARKTVNS